MAVVLVVLAAGLVVLVAGFAALAAGLAALVVGFAVALAAVGLTPFALANLAKAALRRLTVLAFKRPFLTALSYSD